VKVKSGAAWLSAVRILQAGACAGGNGPEAGSPAATPTSSTATRSASPSDTRTYASEAGGGSSFSYPSTWRTSAPATGLVEVTVAAPSDGGDDFVPNINVVIEPLRVDVDAEGYLEASLSAIRSAFNRFELLDQGGISIDGQAAAWIEYEWVTNGRKIRQRQVYLTRGDDGFVITFTATPTTFEEHLESERLVESTFRFDD
jgi:hypothetical protein